MHDFFTVLGLVPNTINGRIQSKQSPQAGTSPAPTLQVELLPRLIIPQLGRCKLCKGRAQDAFISARMERIEQGRKALEAHVAGKAMTLVAEVLEAVPEEPTRHHIQAMLRHEFGDTADTEYLLGDLKDVWETFDLLIELFGIEYAHKMINALPHTTSS